MKEVLIGLLVVVVILGILYYLHTESLEIKEVSLQDARKGLQEGKFRSVIDVRTTSEYQAGHYEGAVSFPLHTINSQTVQRKTISERIYSPVLVYCKSGKRAKLGAQKLYNYGIDDVYYVSSPYWKLSDK